MQKKIEAEKIDITLPGRKPELGNAHPLNLVRQELEDLFIGLGYQVIEGDDIVDDEYCFERANIPKDHPARDMQDSLYIDPNRLLRTHTTAIQMVVLEESAPNLPIKVVCPGKVYRRDDDDATHSHQFMQMEGLVIGEKVTLADLKGTLEFMAKKLFGQDRQIRFRPSYFPFTEPSVEVDVSCHICNGKGCPTCKGTGWIEILGAGYDGYWDNITTEILSNNESDMIQVYPENISTYNAIRDGGTFMDLSEYMSDDLKEKLRFPAMHGEQPESSIANLC